MMKNRIALRVRGMGCAGCAISDDITGDAACHGGRASVVDVHTGSCSVAERTMHISGAMYQNAIGGRICRCHHLVLYRSSSSF